MGIQTIIDKAGFITINKRKGVGQTISRSGHIKTALQQQSIYRFTVSVPDGLRYSENRDFLESIDETDVITEANVDIGLTNTGLSYITAYQGDRTSANLANITVNAVDGNKIYVDTTTCQGTGTIFKVGDYIQPEGNTDTYRYPYQVTTEFSTASSNAFIEVHRPIIPQDGVDLTVGNLRVGNNVRFHLKALTMPIYSVIPHDIISFDGNFELMEVIT